MRLLLLLLGPAAAGVLPRLVNLEQRPEAGPRPTFSGVRFPEQSRWVPEPPLHLAWTFRGLGLCPLGKFGQRRLRHGNVSAAGLEQCLARCGATLGCRVAYFSQRRGACLLDERSCRISEMVPRSSFAAFVRVGHEAPFADQGAVRRLGSAPAVALYAFSSPRFAEMADSFLRSLRLAGDAVEVHLFNSSDFMSAATHRGRKTWLGERGHLEMRRRDFWKFGLLLQALWESIGRGTTSLLFSDIDIHYFPGWSELVTVCTASAHLCVSQGIGTLAQSHMPFNNGFIAYRSSAATLAVMLDLAADYEWLWMMPPEQLTTSYRNDQHVLSEYLFHKGQGLWASLHPEVVKCFLHPVTHPVQMLRVKVHHAAVAKSGPRAGRARVMQHFQRLYYSMRRLCLPVLEEGPEHPCCVLHGHQASLLEAPVPIPPPFLVGGIFGPQPPLASFGDEEVSDHWYYTCLIAMEEKAWTAVEERALEPWH